MLITARRLWLGPGRIRHGWGILVEDDRISQVGPFKRLRADCDPLDVIDYDDACLLPGFVNAHCHLEEGHLRERVSPSGGFSKWFRRLDQEHHAQLESSSVRERIANAIRLGVGELLSHGTTTVYDVSVTGMPADILTGFPLRAICAMECSSLAGKQALALKDAASYLERPQTALLRRTVIPHSLYACSAELLSALSQESFQQATPSLHLAQSLEERDFLDQGMGPLRDLMDSMQPEHDISPVEGLWGRLEAFYPLKSGMLVVHGHGLSSRELRMLAKAKASLVLCPQSMEHLASPQPDFAEIVYRRIGVSLGTESLASGHALSIWREMAVLKGLHPALEAGRILSWATLGGATALGIDCGKFEVGRQADWVAVDCGDVPDDELEEYLVRQEPAVLGVGTGGIQVF